MGAARTNVAEPQLSAAATFGELLRHYRLINRLTQEALAERAGLSVRAILYLERGERSPYSDTLLRLVSALGLADEPRERLLAAAWRASRARAGGRSGADWRGVCEVEYPGALPAPLTALIGREHEVSAVRALVQREMVRLVTLVGPGGVGKTRLAIQVAAYLRAHFAHGVAFASLAQVRDPSLVVSALARAVGVQEAGALPLPLVLANFLRGRQLLLVVDNYEHVLESAPELVALLGACPALRVLSTSRAPLRLQGEQVYPVPPLALPDPGQLPPLDALEQVASVGLFVLRAQAATQDFVLDEANAAAVARICARLDGLPLAIELAAARLTLLPPAALLAQLTTQPLGVLTGGARDAPVRHHTLRQTIAWSYGLLSAAEQTLFRRMAVFSRGASLASIEAVCQMASEDPLAATDVLGGLGTLTELCLLQAHAHETAALPRGEPRFGMLEMVHEYGREQLVAAGETAVLRRWHAAHYLEWVEHEAIPGFLSGEQGTWLARLDAELDNLRAALGWCVERGQGGDRQALEQGLLAAGQLLQFWHVQGHQREGCEWLERLLALAHGEPESRGRGRALYALAFFLYLKGERTRAHVLIDEGVDIVRRVGTVYDLAVALFFSGFIAASSPRPGTTDAAEAPARLEEALALHSRIQSLDAGWLAYTMATQIWLGFALVLQEDLARARAHLDRALEMGRGQALHYPLNHLFFVRATLSQIKGDLQAADADLARSVHHAEAVGMRLDLSRALWMRGDVAQQSGDMLAARVWYTEAIQGYEPLGYILNAMAAWCGLAEVRLACGELAPALRLVAAAMAHTERAGAADALIQVAGYLNLRERLDRVRAVAEALLGPTEGGAVWAAGQAMSMGEVVAEAVRACQSNLERRSLSSRRTASCAAAVSRAQVEI